MNIRVHFEFKNGKQDFFVFELKTSNINTMGQNIRRYIADKFIVEYTDIEGYIHIINFSEVQYVRVSEVKGKV